MQVSVVKILVLSLGVAALVVMLVLRSRGVMLPKPLRTPVLALSAVVTVASFGWSFVSWLGAH